MSIQGQPKTLVTGANGFVGAAVCASLGRQARGSVRRPLDIASEQVVVGDLDASTDWSKALEGCERVVHLAARVHVMADGAEAEYWHTNLEGSVNLAQQAKAAGVRRFVFMSTAKVHGEGAASPYRESDALLPLGPYAASKAAAEEAVLEMQGDGFEVCALRPPLVYGPRVGGNFLKILKLVASGIPLPFGAVRNQRSMISLANLVSAVDIALQHPAAAGKAYLVSDDTALSLPELVTLISQALDQPARLFDVPPAVLRAIAGVVGQADAFEKLAGDFRVSHQAIMADTGWTPPHSSRTAMAEVGQWFRQRRQSDTASTH